MKRQTASSAGPWFVVSKLYFSDLEYARGATITFEKSHTRICFD